MIVFMAEWAGAAMLAAPVIRTVFRAFVLRNDVSRGRETHDFEPKIIRDIHMGRVKTRWCSVCNRSQKAYIHYPERDEPIGQPSKLIELEITDIKWRFENDPEWVKVFGEDYDPKTFQLIPSTHNGECGGPHDSCERCAYEADQADAKAAEERKRQRAQETKSQRTAGESQVEQRNQQSKLDQQEIEEYEEILYTIWNTVHSPEDAREEFEDLRDEMGMVKNPKIRDGVKSLDVWQRLSFCLVNTETYAERWHRREETWHTEKQRRRQRELERSRRYTGYGY